ncbi:MAG TPA: tRNA (cytidine(34)-2'-O)-methyltransferase [Gemmataceae bacterium]
MLHVALWEPEIPPNTGNIARSCAATGTALNLIGKLGFRLDDRSLRRAGCDYWVDVDVRYHATLEEFDAAMGDCRILPFSARGSVPYTAVEYQSGDCLLFGNESQGLSERILRRYPQKPLCIPMQTGKVRSLNLATAAGIALYEALRQLQA